MVTTPLFSERVCIRGRAVACVELCRACSSRRGLPGLVPWSPPTATQERTESTTSLIVV